MTAGIAGGLPRIKHITRRVRNNQVRKHHPCVQNRCPSPYGALPRTPRPSRSLDPCPTCTEVSYPSCNRETYSVQELYVHPAVELAQRPRDAQDLHLHLPLHNHQTAQRGFCYQPRRLGRLLEPQEASYQTMTCDFLSIFTKRLNENCGKTRKATYVFPYEKASKNSRLNREVLSLKNKPSGVSSLTVNTTSAVPPTRYSGRYRTFCPRRKKLIRAFCAFVTSLSSGVYLFEY
jgi:hypothetical protein